MAGAFGILALGVTGSASAACKLNVINQYHVTMDTNEPLADVTINGLHVRFKVDTSSASTLISRRGAEALGLKARRMREAFVPGAGGGDVPGEAFIEELKLGDAVTHNSNMMVFGEGDASAPYVGVLGQDMLGQGDLEFDLANGVMRVIQPKGCGGDQVVYWGKAYSVAPMVTSDDSGDVKVYVGLNGKRALAQLDSGVVVSVVALSAAGRAGVIADRNFQGVIDSSGAPISVGLFPSVAVGDESVKNAKLRIVDEFHGEERRGLGLATPDAADFPDMLLGDDFIRSHHIYVSREQGKLYFSYNGGPIFRASPPKTP